MLTLTAEDAAAYLNMTSRQFRRAVARGDLPQAIIRTRPLRWSKVMLDKALEGAQLVGAPSVGSVDPIMAAIDAA